MTIQRALQISLIISLPIQSLAWWFHFYLFLYIDKKNFNRGKVKRERQKLRDFRHKGKHKIVCYPKYLLLFAAYQVQGWWTMIISPLKDQLYGINFTEIILNSSWHTHLKYSKPNELWCKIWSSELVVPRVISCGARYISGWRALSHIPVWLVHSLILLDNNNV